MNVNETVKSGNVSVENNSKGKNSKLKKATAGAAMAGAGMAGGIAIAEAASAKDAVEVTELPEPQIQLEETAEIPVEPAEQETAVDSENTHIDDGMETRGEQESKEPEDAAEIHPITSEGEYMLPEEIIMTDSPETDAVVDKPTSGDEIIDVSTIDIDDSVCTSEGPCVDVETGPDTFPGHEPDILNDMLA